MEFLRKSKFLFEWFMSGRLRRLYTAEPARMLLDQYRGRIANGPFKGMLYLRTSAGSALAPKIAGTYEKELIATIEKVKTRGYEMVVDIGAAEGYYAVGLARLLGPQTQVYAYDTDGRARALLSELAEMNQVANQITTGELCTHSNLQAFAGIRAMILCDIEGAESELLDPDAASALRHFDILVEIHDAPGEAVTHDLIKGRFESTHQLTVVNAVKRSCEPESREFWIRNEMMCEKIFNEKRERGLQWFFLEANNLNPASNGT